MKFFNRSAADDALLLADLGPADEPGADTIPSNFLADESHPDGSRLLAAHLAGRFAR